MAKEEKYPDFVQSTGYGTGGGLCGWNCRHSFIPFDPATMVNNLKQYGLEENKREYERQQRINKENRKRRKAQMSLNILNKVGKNINDTEIKEEISNQILKQQRIISSLNNS